MLHSRSPSLFKYILCVFLLFISNISNAYTERFTLNISEDSASLNLSLKKGHKIYWQKSGDMGMPTTIDFVGSTNLENYSLWWPSPDIDTTDGITSYTYSNNVIIPLELKPKVLNKPINLKINLNYIICADQCVPVKQVIEAEVAESKKNLSNLYTILIAAFLGGIFLNFMPCILPVLGLKLMSAIKTQGNYRAAFTLTFLGIMTSFLGLAFTSIFLKKSGQQFGIGLGFQQPEFIIFLCIVITVFISLSLDKIQIQLPVFLSNFGVPGINKNGLQKINFHEFFESFTSGVLATLLSIPCTASFLGSAVLVAVVGSNLESILIFVFIGLGFSMPYILLILFPSLINYLPKPGKWMENVKKLWPCF